MRAIAMAIAIAFASVGSALEDSDFLFVPPVFDVTSFGALGDGETDDSQAFFSAWEAACFVPSSTVLFPATYSFVIGPVELSGPCADYITLRVDGTIMARDDLSNWNVDLDGWLVFSGLQLFRLTGYGVIDGRGDFWWAYSCKIYPFADCRTKSPTVGYLSSASRTFRTKQKEQAWDRFETSISLSRSQSVLLRRSSAVEISYLTLKDSQEFHLSVESCNEVYMTGLQVVAPSDSPNTDGIHIVRSENVYLQDTLIGTGDDCISIQTGSYNIYIERVTCGPGHGVSIGGLGKYDSWACVAGVYVKDLVINGAQNGLRIKTWQGGTGVVHDVHFESVTMNDVAFPVIINQFYCDSVLPCENQTDAVQVHDVYFKNIRGTSRTDFSVYLACSDTVPCQNIFLQDVSLTLSGSNDLSTTSSFCWNAMGEWYGAEDPYNCLGSSDTQTPLQFCATTNSKNN